jgi:hypothetical protein
MTAIPKDPSLQGAEVKGEVVRIKDFLDEHRAIVIGRADEVKEIIYFADFARGAMIQNIVARAKKTALKRALAWRRGPAAPASITAR